MTRLPIVLLALVVSLAPATAQNAPEPAADSLPPGGVETTGSVDRTAMDETRAPADSDVADAWIGVPVVSADGVTVGKVADVELGQDGQPVAVTATIGGFLGLGASQVRLPVAAKDFDGEELRIGMVETDIAALAEGDENSAVGIQREIEPGR